MATLNHAKDNRQGAGSPKQYETNGLRGRILVFRFLEPRSTRLSLSPPHTRSPPPPTPTPPPPLPPPRPLLPRLTLFFSVIYPAAHLSFLNEAGGYSRAHSLLSFVSPFSTSYTPPRATSIQHPPLFCPSYFLFLRRMQKERSLFENLETRSRASPPRRVIILLSRIFSLFLFLLSLLVPLLASRFPAFLHIERSRLVLNKTFQ